MKTLERKDGIMKDKKIVDARLHPNILQRILKGQNYTCPFTNLSLFDKNDDIIGVVVKINKKGTHLEDNLQWVHPTSEHSDLL